jgi:hypothetical protein
MLFCICAFAFLVDNFFVTAFILWSVFLYCFFKFALGEVYLGNILYGSMLYYIVKVVFKREHINLFINAVLWFCAANIAFSALQVLGYDFYFVSVLGDQNYTPFGFMANAGITGILYAIGVAFLATRTKWWYGLLLFVPLFFARSTINIIAAISGMLFIGYYKIPKKILAGVVVAFLLFGIFYCTKVDKHIGTERFPIWKLAMHDVVCHPVVGWGMDSYRTIAEHKRFNYGSYETNENTKIQVSPWDNPHNLLISLMYEWGMVGLIIFLGYILSLARKFRYAIKEPNLLALSGAIVAVLIISLAHFPIFLARTAVIVVPIFSLFEVQCNANT